MEVCGIEQRNPLLIEYVDCLHFILSLGLQLNISDKYMYEDLTKEFSGVNEAFSHAFNWTTNLDFLIANGFSKEKCYNYLLNTFLALGNLLGFTFEQIEAAYLEKNKVNHERQANGY